MSAIVTPAQLKALCAVEYLAARGPVTMRAVARLLGVQYFAAYQHLVALRRRGLVTWEGGRAATLRPTFAFAPEARPPA